MIPSSTPVPRPYAMTVGELREYLADLPDWAPVHVQTYDAQDCPDEHDPYLSYRDGVLTIEPA